MPTLLLLAPRPPRFSDLLTALEWKKRSTSGVFLAKWFHCAHPGLLGPEGPRAEAPPDFGRSVNPISRGGRSYPPYYYSAFWILRPSYGPDTTTIVTSLDSTARTAPFLTTSVPAKPSGTYGDSRVLSPLTFDRDIF